MGRRSLRLSPSRHRPAGAVSHPQTSSSSDRALLTFWEHGNETAVAKHCCDPLLVGMAAGVECLNLGFDVVANANELGLLRVDQHVAGMRIAVPRHSNTAGI